MDRYKENYNYKKRSIKRLTKRREGGRKAGVWGKFREACGMVRPPSGASGNIPQDGKHDQEVRRSTTLQKYRATWKLRVLFFGNRGGRNQPTPLPLKKHGGKSSSKQYTNVVVI